MYNSDSIERLSVKISATYGAMLRVSIDISIDISNGISPVATDSRFSESVILERARINEGSLLKSERKTCSALVLYLYDNFKILAPELFFF